MRTKESQLEDFERRQEEKTRRRRQRRTQRYYRILFVCIGALAFLIFAAPSFISTTGIARSLVKRGFARYGWEAEVDTVRFGWITPCSLEDIALVGRSGVSRVQVDRVDSSLTVIDLIRFDSSNIGEVTLRGVELECSVTRDDSSIESDLQAFFADSSGDDTRINADIKVQEAKATLTDHLSGQQWILDQSNISLELRGQEIVGELVGVVTEPDGGAGALQSRFEWTPEPEQGGGENREWQVSIDADSFPLSTVNLLRTRLATLLEPMPTRYYGDITGSISVMGVGDGAVQAAIDDIQVRNLRTNRIASGQDGIGWANSLATFDGELSLSEGWLFGYGLTATTDFAGAQIDGAFPTSVSLTGAGDNPIRWLEMFDGKANIEVDLAALDRSLPGLIPLRENASLVSGRARGTIENVNQSDAGATGRTSKLSFSSDSLRARAGGRAIVIEPVKLTATVSNDGDKIQAEDFAFKSSFANASGHGTLQSGEANVEVDFGRLYSMLRPIIDLSDASLGGSARGNVQWKVTGMRGGQADRWELSGTGEGRNLLVTLPEGTRFKRSIVQGELAIVGRWNGETLNELTAGEVAIRSSGVLAKAELVQPVPHPMTASAFPVRISGDGRLENLSESLRVWLPESIRNAEGRMTWSAEAEVGAGRVLVSKAQMDLNEARVAIYDQWYSQPKLTLDFEGVMDWPSGNLYSETLTLVGEAVSVALRGESSREKTHLDIAWKADLEKLQASVGTRFASAKGVMQNVGYRPVKQESHRLTGRCEGKATITGDNRKLRIETNALGSDLRYLSPAKTTLTPTGMPRGLSNTTTRPPFTSSFANNTGSHELWYEPRLKVQGPVEWDVEKGSWLLHGLQISNDWFGGTFSGTIESREDGSVIRLSGPTRWKMDEIATRLSRLSGSTIMAEGIHETPVEMLIRVGGRDAATVEVRGELGWSRCQVAGVQLGQATLPIQMTEKKLRIAATTIPVSPIGQNKMGTAHVSADVLFGVTGEPTTIEFAKGSRVDSLSITPEMSSTWLRYLAPLASGTTKIEGLVGAEFDAATIVVDDPTESRVRGRLKVERMDFTTGPMAQQLLVGINQLKSLAQLAGNGASEPIAPVEQTLMTMPAQTVDFSFENGVATHQRMYLQIDRAQVMTSGRVNTQSQMDLIVQIPLDPSWLGSDLQGLAGQSVTFPIRGTLSQPKLDSAGVRDVMTRLGTQAGAEIIENRLDNVIQKQLGTGLDQINSGIEKIFGF